MAEYDNISQKYIKVHEERITRDYLYDPSLFEQLGNLKGKNVLDLACGDGRLTREIKKLGAARVIGVDLSEEMIKAAKEKEEENPLGIEYLVGKVGELGKIGEFDIIVGGLLLHYSQTKDELKRMCQDISVNLENGGRFVALNNNPDSPLTDKIKYQTVVETSGNLKEGAKLKVTLIGQDGTNCSFYNYYWKKQTYEECLVQAGLKDIKWIPVSVSEEGIEKYGKEFWEDFLQSPTITLLEARK